MQRCLDLALCGLGSVAPNPLVGAVLVHRGKIIGEGYHQTYGQAHAEVNAIRSVKDATLLKECTLFVNLEPCAHFGKTPPCADLIVERRIPRVVIANRDPFPAVDGKGIERLKQAGVEVSLGILHKEGRDLNRRFFTFHESKRPYILLKWAQSPDGFIDIERPNGERGSHPISSPSSRKLVHLWRSQEPGILVGARTVINDNPQLDVREVDGKAPRIIVLDPDALVSIDAKVLQKKSTLLFVCEDSNQRLSQELQAKARFVRRESFLQEVLNTLYHENIQSLLVEGGAYTLQHFIDASLWDEMRILTGTQALRKGLPAPRAEGRLVEEELYGPDRIQYRRRL